LILSSYSLQTQATISSQKQKDLELLDSKIHTTKEGLQPFVSNYFKIIGIANGMLIVEGLLLQLHFCMNL
jgi:hypothetical protein